MADADSIHGVAPHAVLDQFGKKVGQRVLTDLPQPSGGEFQPPLFVVDQTGISKLAGELGELFHHARSREGLRQENDVGLLALY